jgi:hypothetical protein
MTDLPWPHTNRVSAVVAYMWQRLSEQGVTMPPVEQYYVEMFEGACDQLAFAIENDPEIYGTLWQAQIVNDETTVSSCG